MTKKKKLHYLLGFQKMLLEIIFKKILNTSVYQTRPFIICYPLANETYQTELNMRKDNKERQQPGMILSNWTSTISGNQFFIFYDPLLWKLLIFLLFSFGCMVGIVANSCLYPLKIKGRVSTEWHPRLHH